MEALLPGALADFFRSRVWEVLVSSFPRLLGYGVRVTIPLALLSFALAMVIAACIAYAIVHMYVWPLTASVENTNFQMIKNSLLIGTHYLFCTICVFSIYCAMAFLIIAFFTPLFILGVGLCAVLSSYLLNPVIRVSSFDPNRNRELSD
jgi:uncharacterized membrane protein YesL